MDASGGRRGGAAGEPQVGTAWLLKVALLFTLTVVVGVSLGIGLGVIPV
jgi:hypothetical protein